MLTFIEPTNKQKKNESSVTKRTLKLDVATGLFKKRGNFPRVTKS
jgi:hypothetical protein